MDTAAATAAAAAVRESHRSPYLLRLEAGNVSVHYVVPSFEKYQSYDHDEPVLSTVVCPLRLFCRSVNLL